MNDGNWKNTLTYNDIRWMYDRLSLVEYQIGYIRDNQDIPLDTDMLTKMMNQLHRVTDKLYHAKDIIT